MKKVKNDLKLIFDLCAELLNFRITQKMKKMNTEVMKKNNSKLKLFQDSSRLVRETNSGSMSNLRSNHVMSAAPRDNHYRRETSIPPGTHSRSLPRNIRIDRLILASDWLSKFDTIL